MVLAGAGIYANAYDGDNIQPWLRSADTHRNNLEDDAKEVASDEGLAASEYWNERNELEYARACLIPKGTGINLGNTMDGHSSMTPGGTCMAVCCYNKIYQGESSKNIRNE